MITSKPANAHEIVDPFNRQITYLRVSLTERCNLKCRYCFDSLESCRGYAARLSDAQIMRLVRLFARLGVEKIRFSGGEPLLRRGLLNLIRETSGIPGIAAVGITTNGLGLEPCLPDLIGAGLNRLNISLDSLDRATFRSITGIDGLPHVLSAINAALDSNAFQFVKINTVVIRGVNDHELPFLARWALNRKLTLRFIEFMPTAESGWSRELFVSEFEIFKRIGLDLERDCVCQASAGPEIRYRYRDFPGRIGFISAVSKSFCARCNRLRITSRGELIGCLFQCHRIDLKTLLDRSAPDEEIIDLILRTTNVAGFRRAPELLSISNYEPFMKAVGG
jgi:cyclic pyranopterin phosphate synthase